MTNKPTSLSNYIHDDHFWKFGLTAVDISEVINVLIDWWVNNQAPFKECSGNFLLYESEQEQQ